MEALDNVGVRLLAPALLGWPLARAAEAQIAAGGQLEAVCVDGDDAIAAVAEEKHTVRNLSTHARELFEKCSGVLISERR
jgi:hypothetical protein